MRQEQWGPRKRVEQQYQADIMALLRGSLAASEGERAALMGSPEFVARWAWQAARRMVTGLLYDGARTWQQAARESMQGARVYRALEEELQGPVGERMRELVQSNAQLIRTLPISVAERVTALAAKHAVAGERAAGFSSGEGLLNRISRSRAMLVARTEVSKASTALTQARSESLGLDWYVWETSGDQRVRPAHRKMQGVLVSFDDPPAPEQLAGMAAEGHYNAGNIYNCRCYPAPLLALGQVAWPHRVYRAGAVRYMTRGQFSSIYEVPLRRAA